MSPLYAAWWRTWMDRRGWLRHAAARAPRLAPKAVRARTFAHLIAGNPVTALGVVAGWQSWRVGAPFLVSALLVVALHAGISLLTYAEMREPTGSWGGWLVGWRQWWLLRRRLPWVWDEVAVKTRKVQAEVGTSAEASSSAVLRPIADHPKTGWWPTISWPVVTCWVSPPPGRSMPALAELCEVLAANMAHVHSVDVDFERPSDSYGRLSFTFADPLTSQPDPATVVWDAPAVVGPIEEDSSYAVVLELRPRHGTEDGEAS